jgi:putative copper resistance protein D
MDLALVVARFVHFAAMLTLFGAAFFASVLAPASLGRDLEPLLRRLVLPLALLALASAVAWAVFVARAMADGDLDLSIVSDVLNGTAFGHVWRVRLALLAALVVAALRPGERWRPPALIGGLALASLGLVGHAAMQEGLLGAAHRLNHALHLLAVSAWLGGLPPFLVCLALFAQSRERRDALCAMVSYSRLGHFAVAAVFLSGALDTIMTTGAPWPIAGPYRTTLAAKVLIFAAMTTLALINRYVLAPRIGRDRAAAAALAAGALAEIALGLTAIALVSALATFNPN